DEVVHEADLAFLGAAGAVQDDDGGQPPLHFFGAKDQYRHALDRPAAFFLGGEAGLFARTVDGHVAGRVELHLRPVEQLLERLPHFGRGGVLDVLREQELRNQYQGGDKHQSAHSCLLKPRDERSDSRGSYLQESLRSSWGLAWNQSLCILR